MFDRVEVRQGVYYDSVTLMLVSKQVSAVEGVVEAAIVAATPLNLDLVSRQGFKVSEPAGPNDLLIALRCESESALAMASAELERSLSQKQSALATGATETPVVSIRVEHRLHPGTNIALLSVPGRCLGYEISSALAAGMHVFCFSDGLSLEDEVRYKQLAIESGLMLMGPDCGTAIIDGIGLGFANALRRGPVGIVGASGTGIQEIGCLLDRAGIGISHAIGVGGRDLSTEVGGLMTLKALELLGQDPRTETIVVVSKPPDAGVASTVAAAASATGKPTVLCFTGLPQEIELPAGVELVSRLFDAAEWAAGRHGGVLTLSSQSRGPAKRSGFIRGLFSGGTLCYEAMSMVASGVGKVASNTPLRKEWKLADVNTSDGHTFIDFGDDELTVGRAHPMIDMSLRLDRFDVEAADPAVAVLLLDVVLGYGAHPDPASELAPRIRAALSRRRTDLAVVVSVCGSAADSQNAARQAEILESAGAQVASSSAVAARESLAAVGIG